MWGKVSLLPRKRRRAKREESELRRVLNRLGPRRYLPAGATFGPAEERRGDSGARLEGHKVRLGRRLLLLLWFFGAQTGRLSPVRLRVKRERTGADVSLSSGQTQE